MTNPYVVSAGELKTEYNQGISVKVAEELKVISLALSNYIKRKNTGLTNTVTAAYYKDYDNSGQPLFSAPDETSPPVELNVGLYFPKHSDTEEFKDLVEVGFNNLMLSLSGFTVEPFDAWARVLETVVTPSGLGITATWKRVVVRRISWNNG